MNTTNELSTNEEHYRHHSDSSHLGYHDLFGKSKDEDENVFYEFVQDGHHDESDDENDLLEKEKEELRKNRVESSSLTTTPERRGSARVMSSLRNLIKGGSGILSVRNSPLGSSSSSMTSSKSGSSADSPRNTTERKSPVDSSNGKIKMNSPLRTEGKSIDKTKKAMEFEFSLDTSVTRSAAQSIDEEIRSEDGSEAGESEAYRNSPIQQQRRARGDSSPLSRLRKISGVKNAPPPSPLRKEKKILE